eukprot:superscaffoldBa00002092_g13137
MIALETDKCAGCNQARQLTQAALFWEVQRSLGGGFDRAQTPLSLLSLLHFNPSHTLSPHLLLTVIREAAYGSIGLATLRFNSSNLQSESQDQLDLPSAYLMAQIPLSCQ